MMELILWRHAEAHDAKEGQDDLERALTPRGEKQAARMSAWLERQLPQGLRVVSSPARRTEQTAQALGRKYKLRAELLPDGTPTDLLELVQWEKGNGAVLVVGHQPLLGQTAAHLLGLGQEACSIRKGAVWWLRRRQRLEHNQTVLMAVMCPEFL
jgi:phosphohistidine phosphatase